jgi:hypothetical protein
MPNGSSSSGNLRQSRPRWSGEVKRMVGSGWHGLPSTAGICRRIIWGSVASGHALKEVSRLWMSKRKSMSISTLPIECRAICQRCQWRRDGSSTHVSAACNVVFDGNGARCCTMSCPCIPQIEAYVVVESRATLSPSQVTRRVRSPPLGSGSGGRIRELRLDSPLFLPLLPLRQFPRQLYRIIPLDRFSC